MEKKGYFSHSGRLTCTFDKLRQQQYSLPNEELQNLRQIEAKIQMRSLSTVIILETLELLLTLL